MNDRAPNLKGVETPGKRTVMSICGMCAVRCPIEVRVEDGKPVWIQGNPRDKAMGTSLCPKGAAGVSMQYDDQRPQHPMIRTGPRGSGNWRRAEWGEALDHVSQGLKKVMERMGGRGVALSDRGGPFNDLTKAFLRALGSPNYFNHDCTCACNVNHAAQSLFGWGRKGFSYDIRNTRHLVLYGRNLIESLQVKEVKEFIDALEAGARCTYIDVRATLTASKASRFWMIRPGTDYALNLALIHQILQEGLYDRSFVEKNALGLAELTREVSGCDSRWASEITGIPAREIVALARETAAAAPRVIFHPGWMNSRHGQSFYVSRTAYILNVLMGNIEAKGGLILTKGPGDVGKKGLKKLVDRFPKVDEPRVDGVGTRFKHFDSGPGLLHLLFPAIESGDPYPMGAYLVYRHDPLTSLPDPEEQKRILDKLELLVSIDVNYSETAWFSDVILPECTYLERGNILGQKSGTKPSFIIRDQAVAPRYDTRPGWWIFREIIRRLDIPGFDFESLEEIWQYQLEGTGVSLEELRDKGSASLVDKPVMYDREDLKFKTASGKIELDSSRLKEAGFPSLAPFQAPMEPPQGSFRLVFGRVAAHNHGHTMNNPLLHELAPENTLWINSEAARDLGISDGDLVEVASDGATARGRATVTDWIHPRAVYMIHGFGRTVPRQTRAFAKGMADQRLMKGKLTSYDPVGGGNNLTESLVTVRRIG